MDFGNLKEMAQEKLQEFKGIASEKAGSIIDDVASKLKEQAKKVGK